MIMTRKFDITCSGLTSSALAQSIDRIKASGDIEKLACVTSLCSKPMELARYFCTGMYEQHEYHHYALNVPLYTHFTSPIRRYPDILVHRLLDMAVRGQTAEWDSVEVCCKSNIFSLKYPIVRLRRLPNTAMTRG